MSSKRIVLKFGSSVLRTSDDLPGAVHEIFRYVRDGFRVVAVVSAFEGVTDRLLAKGRELGADPDHDVGIGGLAALVASGERETAAALQIALSRSGLDACVLDPIAAGLRVEGNGLEGAPIDLAVARFERLFDRGRIVIVPGFFGADEDDGPSLLGRGGSDWTAIFVAQRLGGTCRLLKDTDGIYERDPNAVADAPALRFERLSYEDAVALDAPVVQKAALDFARAHRQAFEVAKLASTLGTTVGSHSTFVARRSEAKRAPIRVALLGLGAVGRGVFEHLSRDREKFDVVAIAVRDRDKHLIAGAPASLICSLDEALARPFDLLVEAIGGVDAPARALRFALGSGRHAVTANKAVIASIGPELRELATREGAHLAFSAAVGGVVPVIETLRAIKSPVEHVEGILNGTSNYVLERLAAGDTAAVAIAEARRLGYAEPDPGDDLSGLDVARKLTLIAREAFGADVALERIELPAASVADWNAPARKGIPRLIGRVEATVNGASASVRLVEVGNDHPFASCRGADNVVIITLRGGQTVELRGRGASRWPTAESVIGDVLRIWRERESPVERKAAILGEFEGRAS